MLYMVLCILFVAALCGMTASLSEVEEEHSDFRVFFIPGGGTFEYNIVSGEGVLRGAEPAHEYDWIPINGGYSHIFKFFPSTINLKENWDEVKYLLNPETGKAEEIDRDSYW